MELKEINLNFYYKLPKELLNLWCDKKISTTGFKILILFIDLYKSSKKDYIYLSYDTIQDKLKLKKRNSISRAIKELETLKLIIVEYGSKGKTNRYYLKLLKDKTKEWW